MFKHMVPDVIPGKKKTKTQHRGTELKSLL